jgi:glycosyltransferase involved in cell wall biosynthesis
LLCSEGTYPFYEGGVSVWCDQLVRELNDHRFHAFAITHSPNRISLFPVHPNLQSVQELALWGTDEPGAPARSFSDIYKKKARTTNDVIRNEFLDDFSTMVRCLFSKQEPEKLANALLMLQLYFRRSDYLKSMSSLQAWEAFCQALQESPFGSAATVHDMTTCLRWLQRLLGVLTVQLPERDVTHTSMAGIAGIPGVMDKLLQGTPFLLTEHGIFLRELYLSLRHSGYSEVCRRFLLSFHESIVRMNYHFADSVTALGDFNKNWQIKLGADERKIRITPNGVDPYGFQEPRRPCGERLVVLTMARIYHLKGIEYLLRAAAQVVPRVPKVLFRILGEVADRSYYQRCLDLVAEFGLQGHVEFGTTKDIAAAYAEADVFCLPSISEGMPYAILEAMFSECPVVATDVGNVAEMLASTGLVARPGDPGSLAEALLSVLEGGEEAADYRASMARAALERAQSFYTIEKATGNFRRLYQVLVNGTSNTKSFATASR